MKNHCRSLKNKNHHYWNSFFQVYSLSHQYIFVMHYSIFIAIDVQTIQPFWNLNCCILQNGAITKSHCRSLKNGSQQYCKCYNSTVVTCTKNRTHWWNSSKVKAGSSKHWYLYQVSSILQVARPTEKFLIQSKPSQWNKKTMLKFYSTFD